MAGQGAARPRHRAHPLDATAELPDAVVELLAAAAAPARPDELAGEEAAVRAFHAARRQLTPAPTPDRARRSRRRLRMGVGAWVAAAVAVLTAGAALAATRAGRDGTTPPPVPRSAAPATVPAASAGSSTTAGPGTAPPGPAVSGSPAPTTAAVSGPALPRPAVTGLCRAYLATRRTGDAAPDSAAFAALTELAGGPGEVDGYCRRVLGGAPAPGPDRPGANRGGPAPTAGQSGQERGDAGPERTSGPSGRSAVGSGQARSPAG